MLDGLIVAAGKSSRTPGHFKMTLDLGGKPLIVRTVDSLRSVCDRIILVTGNQASRLEALFAEQKDVELVYNPDYLEGMFSSIKAGLLNIRSSRFLFLPGDYPLIAPSVLKSLLAADAPVVIPTYAGEPGHPVLIRRDLIEQILNNPVLQSLNDFIQLQNPEKVPVDHQGILLDVDTLSDYESALALMTDSQRYER